MTTNEFQIPPCPPYADQDPKETVRIPWRADARYVLAHHSPFAADVIIAKCEGPSREVRAHVIAFCVTNYQRLYNSWYAATSLIERAEERLCEVLGEARRQGLLSLVEHVKPFRSKQEAAPYRPLPMGQLKFENRPPGISLRDWTIIIERVNSYEALCAEADRFEEMAVNALGAVGVANGALRQVPEVVRAPLSVFLNMHRATRLALVEIVDKGISDAPAAPAQVLLDLLRALVSVEDTR